MRNKEETPGLSHSSWIFEGHRVTVKDVQDKKTSSWSSSKGLDPEDRSVASGAQLKRSLRLLNQSNGSTANWEPEVGRSCWAAALVFQSPPSTPHPTHTMLKLSRHVIIICFYFNQLKAEFMLNSRYSTFSDTWPRAVPQGNCGGAVVQYNSTQQEEETNVGTRSSTAAMFVYVWKTNIGTDENVSLSAVP